MLYDASRSAAVRPRDADAAAWNAADALVRAGRISEAVGRLDAIARDAASGHQAEAAYRAATLRIEHGDEERGWRDMEQVPRRFPLHGIAHVAVRRLVDHARDAGAPAATGELGALERDVGATELGETVALLSAEQLEQMGDAEAARDAYVRMARRSGRYRRGTFFDEALWRASLLDEKLGRYAAAVDDLNRLLAPRETASLAGSYERPRVRARGAHDR